VEATGTLWRIQQYKRALALLEAPMCVRPTMVFTIKPDALGPFPKAQKPSFFTAALVRSVS
jgi:hypothetical protein